MQHATPHNMKEMIPEIEAMHVNSVLLEHGIRMMVTNYAIRCIESWIALIHNKELQLCIWTVVHGDLSRRRHTSAITIHAIRVLERISIADLDGSLVGHMSSNDRLQFNSLNVEAKLARIIVAIGL